MVKRNKSEKQQIKKKGSAGFTLMELIIVIAILAMLTALLLPRFSNYTDKAMGTTAASDIRNILTVASAANLDKNTAITLAELQTETGITGVGGKGLAAGTDTAHFTYTYIRGGAGISANINVQNGTITYRINGGGGPLTIPGTAPIPGTDTQVGRIAKGLGF